MECHSGDTLTLWLKITPRVGTLVACKRVSKARAQSVETMECRPIEGHRAITEFRVHSRKFTFVKLECIIKDTHTYRVGL